MAEGISGGIGVLGVLIGALIVIVVGGGLLFATGNLGGGHNSSTLKVELPKKRYPSSGTSQREFSLLCFQSFAFSSSRPKERHWPASPRCIWERWFGLSFGL